MVDYIKVSADIGVCFYELTINFPDVLEFANLSLIPIRDTTTFNIIRYECIVDNLRFVIQGSKLIISNSLHKFYKNNNYSDFPYSELLQAIKKIERLTGIAADIFTVIKLEFGLNIVTDSTPTSYLTSFGNYKTVRYDKMKKLSSWYGVKYSLSEYAIKAYDKTKETAIRERATSLEKNIFRFEIQYRKQRICPFISTLSDLQNKELIMQIFSDFISKVRKINCDGNEDFKAVKSRDRELFFAGKSEKFWEVEKSQNPHTAKEKKKRYKSILSIVNPTNIIHEFVYQLESKFHILLNT